MCSVCDDDDDDGTKSQARVVGMEARRKEWHTHHVSAVFGIQFLAPWDSLPP